MTLSAPLTAWSQDYVLGINEIDEQHRIVFERIDALRMAINHGKPKRQIGALIDQLIDYTQVHLLMEEKAMRLMAYPEYAEHKRLHDAGLINMEVFAQQYHADEGHAAQAFLDYVAHWWDQHILDGDARYVRSLRSGSPGTRWLPDLGALLRRVRKGSARNTVTGA